MGAIDGSWNRRLGADIVGETYSGGASVGIEVAVKLLLELRSGGAIVGIEERWSSCWN